MAPYCQWGTAPQRAQRNSAYEDAHVKRAKADVDNQPRFGAY